MRKSLLRVALAAAMVCVVLAPALIWSGQRPQPANDATNEDRGDFKGPAVFTVGPPATPGEFAAREREKLLSIAEARTRDWEFWAASQRFQAAASDVPLEAIVRPDAVDLLAKKHPGLTPAELEKLAAIRNGTLKPRQDRGVWAPKEEPQAPKYDAPLRPPGFEGLTPEERAKLEASRTRDKNATGNEGGRSR